MKRTILLYIAIIIVAIANAATPWKAGTKVSANTIKQQGIEKFFAIDTISNEVYHRIANKSLPKNNHISRHDLRYLRLLHYDIQGNILRGEMVCNKAIAHDLVEIFRTLFESRYPIERMQLIDDYAANDDLSMSHNNTSCFCYRPVAGLRTLYTFSQRPLLSSIYKAWFPLGRSLAHHQRLSAFRKVNICLYSEVFCY